MRTLFFIALTFLPALMLPAQDAPAPAAPGPLNLEQEMEALYGEAATAFNQGKYEVALQKIGAIHAKTSNRDFEKVMFLEGAAHYNLEQYDKAVEFLQKFVETFAQSEVLHEAKMSLGRAYLKLGKEDEGVKILKEVAAIPTLRDQAGLEIANYFKGKQNLDEALDILQVILKDLAGAPTQEQQQAILMAAEIHVGKGESDQASQMMEKLRTGSAGDESIVQLNNLGVKVGDAMLEQKRYREALMAYQSVRRQSEIVRIQKSRVTRVEQWITQIAAGRKVYFMGRPLSKEEAELMLEANKAILAEIEGAKDYDAAIYYRLGQCFYEMGRYYEALLSFTKIYEEFRDFPDRHRCLFGMIVCNAALQRSARAYALCEKYMEQFPDGPNTTQVTDMFGSLAYESGNIQAAVRAFQRALAAPDADKQRLNFLLGIVLFESQQFDDSRLAFQALLQEDKNSAYKDDAEYRIALTYFFENNSQETRRKLRDYINGNPKGQYVVDAKYRLAFIEFQASTTGQGGSRKEALEQLEALVVESPNDPNIGQVYSLLGDIYSQSLADSSGTDYVQKALDAYRNAVDKAKTEDVLNYAIDAATNMMVDKGMWNELSTMWSTYYSTNKDSIHALKAIYWISRATEREARLLEADGKPDEAVQKSQEARRLVAQAIMPHIGNPANEQVEVLIQQLVTMVTPRRRPRASAEDAPDAASFESVEQEFVKLLTPEGDGTINGTAAARTLYGRALIARFMRDVPKFENLVSIIPDAARADELSPLLLATLGEMLSRQGDADKAVEYFNILREKYPLSEFADKAPVGLGLIEYDKEEYEKALDLFNEAIEKYTASSSLLDATLGKAKTLFALKKFDEADELYKTIFATREWRGEAHAIALYMQGQIAENKREWESAVSFYQRVYVSQQRFKEWVAKAYLQGAKSLLELNRREDAGKLLREMLSKSDLQDQPPFREAQQLLARTSG